MKNSENPEIKSMGVAFEKRRGYLNIVDNNLNV